MVSKSVKNLPKSEYHFKLKKSDDGRMEVYEVKSELCNDPAFLYLVYPKKLKATIDSKEVVPFGKPQKLMDLFSDLEAKVYYQFRKDTSRSKKFKDAFGYMYSKSYRYVQFYNLNKE
jgi:hypothetical protein